MSGFGARLKAERKRIGLSAGKFSALCGVAENAQYNYEKETRSPDSVYLEMAADAGVDVFFLITGKKTASTLSADQQQLLSAYAAAAPALRAAALAVLTSQPEPVGLRVVPVREEPPKVGALHGEIERRKASTVQRAKDRK